VLCVGGRKFTADHAIDLNAAMRSSIDYAPCPHYKDKCAYTPPSLRRGFATAASKQGTPFHAIMRQGRWCHQGTVLGYIEAGQRFEENAAKVLLSKGK